MGTATNVTMTRCDAEWLLPVSWLPHGWYDGTHAQCSMLLRAAAADHVLRLAPEWETLRTMTVGMCTPGMHSKEVRGCAEGYQGYWAHAPLLLAAARVHVRYSSGQVVALRRSDVQPVLRRSDGYHPASRLQ